MLCWTALLCNGLMKNWNRDVHSLLLCRSLSDPALRALCAIFPESCLQSTFLPCRTHLAPHVIASTPLYSHVWAIYRYSAALIRAIHVLNSLRAGGGIYIFTQNHLRHRLFVLLHVVGLQIWVPLYLRKILSLLMSSTRSFLWGFKWILPDDSTYMKCSRPDQDSRSTNDELITKVSMRVVIIPDQEGALKANFSDGCAPLKLQFWYFHIISESSSK